jgi:competence protein ComEC
MKTAKDAFLLKEWLAADADARLPGDASLADGVSCDEAGCVAQMPDGAFVALVLRPEALSDDCERAAVIVTSRQAPPECKALVIGRERLQKQAATSLRRTRGGFVIDAVRPNGLDRPWSPAIGVRLRVPRMQRRRKPTSRRRNSYPAQYFR